jgi:hypothetical protein
MLAEKSTVLRFQSSIVLRCSSITSAASRIVSSNLCQRGARRWSTQPFDNVTLHHRFSEPAAPPIPCSPSQPASPAAHAPQTTAPEQALHSLHPSL